MGAPFHRQAPVDELGQACAEATRVSLTSAGLPRLSGAALVAGGGAPRAPPQAVSTALAQKLRVSPPQADAGSEVICSICLEPAATRAWRQLSCGHGFHEGCILRWVQHARHAHCPMCRGDLEASALHEFEAAYETFRRDLATCRDASPRQMKLRLARVAAERCRRRLYDAALARFLKLLTTSDHAVDCVREARQAVNDLLQELSKLREFLEQRHPTASCARETGTQCLQLLGCQLDGLHFVLKKLCEETTTSSNDGDRLVCVLSDSRIVGSLREHLGRLQSLCGSSRLDENMLATVPQKAKLGGS